MTGSPGMFWPATSGMWQAGEPRPAPGAQATGMGWPAIAGASAVRASDSVFQSPVGVASRPGGMAAGAGGGAGAAGADRAGQVLGRRGGEGLELADEGEGGDAPGAAEGLGEGGGCDVA